MGLMASMFPRLLTAQTLQGQSAAKSETGQSKPISLPHLYWHCLVYQHRLDQYAAEYEKQGKNGRGLRSYLQKKLSMTDADFQPIRESAERLDSRVAALDTQANAIISSIRAVPNQDEGSALIIQKYRAQLTDLTTQREKAINDEVERLNSALTPEAARKFKDYLETSFSRYVSIAKIPRKGSFNPGQSLSTTQREVQP